MVALKMVKAPRVVTKAELLKRVSSLEKSVRELAVLIEHSEISDDGEKAGPIAHCGPGSQD